MSSRPAPPRTILLVTRDHVARADVRGSSVRGVVRADARADWDLPTSLAAAAALGGKLRGPVVVLLDDVHLQVVSVRASAVGGLDDAALRRLLGYEAQALSGVAPGDGVLAWTRLPSDGIDESFLVAQLPRAAWEDMQRAVRGRGARLGAVLHPAGVPTALAGATGRSPAAWSRAELWADLTAVVGAADGVARPPRLVRREPVRAFEEAEAEVPETLVGTSRPPEAGGSAAFDLRDDAALTAWLGAWARVLTRSGSGAVALRPPRRPLPAGAQAGIAIVLAGVTGLACAWDDQGARKALDALRAEREEAAKPADLLKKARAEASTKEREAKKLQAELAALDERSMAADRLKRLPTLALDLLARGAPEGTWIDGIEMDLGTTRVRGRSRQPGAADELAAFLAKGLEHEAARVTVPSRTLAPGGSDAGLYRFEILLELPGRGVAALATVEGDAP